MTATVSYITEIGKNEELYTIYLGSRKAADLWVHSMVHNWESDGFYTKWDSKWELMFVSGVNIRPIKIMVEE